MQSKLTQLAALVVAWAEARNLVKGATAKDQTLKTVSELGELCEAVAYSQGPERVRDGIGDVMVTQIIVCAQLGLNWVETLPQQPSTGWMSEHSKLLFLSIDAGRMADNVLKGQLDDFKTNLTQFNSVLRDFTSQWVSSNSETPLVPLTMEEALEAAYNEIKDRKGVMFNGVFIKSTDERYASACAELGVAPEAL